MSATRPRPTAHSRLRASILIVALTVFASVTGPASAQTLEGLSIGGEAFRFERTTRGQFDMESDDPFYGARLGYTHKFYGAWFARLHGRYAKGETSSTFSNGDSDQAIPQEIWEARLEFGRDIGFEGTIGLAPFIGVGYRHYYDEGFGRRTQNGTQLFDSRTEFFYVPMGFTTYFVLGDAWSISTQAEFSVLVEGRSKNETAALPGFSSDVDPDLTTGIGIGAEILLRKRLTKSYALEFGPFIKYWDISDSEVDNGFFILGSESIEAGLTFKMNIGPPL